MVYCCMILSVEVLLNQRGSISLPIDGLAGICFFEVNKGNSRTVCEICMLNVIQVVLLLNRFHTLFWDSIIDFEQGIAV